MAVDREAFSDRIFDRFDAELALMVVIDGKHLW
jgi:hypothetical protein